MAVVPIDADLHDPTPDIHSLFREYDEIYFDGILLRTGTVTVRWSKSNMTLCAGLCKYKGRLGGCEIVLSRPLLQFRTVGEMKETLLHEMIHAVQFVTNNNDNHDDHGPKFKEHMLRINHSKKFDPHRPSSGYHISVYHNFTEEVSYLRGHHWECNKCGDVIARSMNRAPSEKDCRAYRKDGSLWKERVPPGENKCGDKWCKAHNHMRTCGGTWIKTKEPDGLKRKRNSEKKDLKSEKRRVTIQDSFNGKIGGKDSNSRDDKSGNGARAGVSSISGRAEGGRERGGRERGSKDLSRKNYGITREDFNDIFEVEEMGLEGNVLIGAKTGVKDEEAAARKRLEEDNAFNVMRAREDKDLVEALRISLEVKGGDIRGRTKDGAVNGDELRKKVQRTLGFFVHSPQKQRDDVQGKPMNDTNMKQLSPSLLYKPLPVLSAPSTPSFLANPSPEDNYSSLYNVDPSPPLTPATKLATEASVAEYEKERSRAPAESPVPYWKRSPTKLSSSPFSPPVSLPPSSSSYSSFSSSSYSPSSSSSLSTNEYKTHSIFSHSPSDELESSSRSPYYASNSSSFSSSYSSSSASLSTLSSSTPTSISSQRFRLQLSYTEDEDDGDDEGSLVVKPPSNLPGSFSSFSSSPSRPFSPTVPPLPPSSLLTPSLAHKRNIIKSRIEVGAKNSRSSGKLISLSSSTSSSFSSSSSSSIPTSSSFPTSRSTRAALLSSSAAPTIAPHYSIHPSSQTRLHSSSLLVMPSSSSSLLTSCSSPSSSSSCSSSSSSSSFPPLRLSSTVSIRSHVQPSSTSAPDPSRIFNLQSPSLSPSSSYSLSSSSSSSSSRRDSQHSSVFFSHVPAAIGRSQPTEIIDLSRCDSPVLSSSSFSSSIGGGNCNDDISNIVILIEMGFDANKSKEALKNADGDLDRAVAYLLPQ